MTNDYIKKILEDLFKMNEERKQELANIDINELVDEIYEEIFVKKEEPKEKEFAHMFICLDNATAKEVNVFPDFVAEVRENIVFVKRVDKFTETKDLVTIEALGITYEIPQKYSYSFSFVR